MTVLLVNPARAGMILGIVSYVGVPRGKPRVSGDDPGATYNAVRSRL